MSNREANCVFCKIAAGEIPCHRVHEDAHTIAFLDIAPVATGHAIVIPRHHAMRLDELPATELARAAEALGAVAGRVLRATGCTAYNVLQNNGEAAGQVVMHVHFHIIPRRAGDGLGFRWNATKPSKEDLAKLAERMRGV